MEKKNTIPKRRKNMEKKNTTALCLGIAVLSMCATNLRFVKEADEWETPDGEMVNEEKIYADQQKKQIEDGKPSLPINEEKPVTKTKTQKPKAEKVFFKGNIYDTNNLPVIYTDKNNKRVMEESCSISLGNVIGKESNIMLDTRAETYLVKENPTPCNTISGELLGQSVRITIDSDLQSSIYSYFEENDINGTACVIDDDGAVRAMVSYPSYDANNYDVYLLDKDACNNYAVLGTEPGSSFKMMSAAIAESEGMLNFTDYGYGFTEDEWGGIKNWDYEENKWMYPIDRTLTDAVTESSNYVFADVFSKLGKERVLQKLKDYFAYDTTIECDFGSLKNTIRLDEYGDLTRAGFGQSSTTSITYISMIAQSVINGGEMLKPYMLSETLDSITMEPVQTIGGKEVVSVINPEYLTSVREGMYNVANRCSFYAGEWNTVYAKTGTAETGVGNDVHVIAGAVEKSNGEVVAVAFQQFNSKQKYSSGDSVHYQEILNRVFNLQEDNFMF